MDGDPTGTVDVNDLTIVLSNFGQGTGRRRQPRPCRSPARSYWRRPPLRFCWDCSLAASACESCVTRRGQTGIRD